MKCHVARTAKCESVTYIKPEIRELRIRLDMVRRKPFLCLVALSPTMLARVGIAFKHSLTPRLVFRRLEPLPRFATFPLIVGGPTIPYGALLQTLACLSGDWSPLQCTAANLVSRLHTMHATVHTLRLNYAHIVRVLSHPASRSIQPDSCPSPT